MANDALYNDVYNISSCAKKYPGTVVYATIKKTRYIDNPKVQVVYEMKRDIFKYVVKFCMHYV